MHISEVGGRQLARRTLTRVGDGRVPAGDAVPSVSDVEEGQCSHGLTEIEHVNQPPSSVCSQTTNPAKCSLLAKCSRVTVEMTIGDIVLQEEDAIVSAANARVI